MINRSFLSVFYDHHQGIKTGKPAPGPDNFESIENIWMGFYGLGKFETYQFLYNQCAGIEDLEKWIINLKGEQQVEAASSAFDRWAQGTKNETQTTNTSILTQAQWQSWNQQGYIKISDLVDARLCDAVSKCICSHLGVDLDDPQTWYGNHPEWHGLMLQLYQDESIEAIKKLPAIRQVFAELYDTSDIIANTEKVSFNPPESLSWKFGHNKLHWDIDFERIDLDYIQGLVYLNDVPEDRGPLQLVPGFHHRFGEWIKAYPDSNKAHEILQTTLSGTPIPGKKGDIVLWRQTLPHSATANHSDLPRFVQYISFSKCQSAI